MASVQIMAGDGATVLRVTIRDSETNDLIDLTGKTVKVRYSLNGAAAVEKNMTALNQTTLKGQAQYQFLITDLTSAGELVCEVRIQAGLSDQLTTVDRFHLQVGAPLP